MQYYQNQIMKIKIAILDLYAGVANEGMRCIREIINQWGEANFLQLDVQTFDVRLKCELPDLSFDLYISTGGPGSPLESIGEEWDTKFCKWIEKVEKWNNNAANISKKKIFFICHSFQIASRHYKVAKVCKRKSTSFGVLPMHIMPDGEDEPVFEGLPNPFYAVDSRDYQVIEPDHNRLKKMGAKILAIEKERRHVPFERATMAIRFNEHFIGTQFHPEADAVGMSMYLQREDKKKTIIENHGEEKWKSMIERLSDPDKIMLTNRQVLPNFLNSAIPSTVEILQTA